MNYLHVKKHQLWIENGWVTRGKDHKMLSFSNLTQVEVEKFVVGYNIYIRPDGKTTIWYDLFLFQYKESLSKKQKHTSEYNRMQRVRPPELYKVYRVPKPQTGVPAEHDAGLSKLRTEGIVMDRLEVLETARLDKVGVGEWLFREVNFGLFAIGEPEKGEEVETLIFWGA